MSVKNVTVEGRKRILFGILAAFLTFVLTMSVYHLWGADIRVPIAGYRGDSVGMLLEVNNYVRGGNIHSNAVFGAPGMGRYRSVMADYAMMLPTSALFWKMTGSVEAAVNMQLIFNNIILALSMYFVCTRLGISEIVSSVAGVLVPLGPFLVLGYNTIMLTYLHCFYLPFFVYYVIRMMMPDGGGVQGGESVPDVLLMMLVMFVTGANSLYYAFFCLIILAFVGLYALCAERSARNVLRVILCFLAMGYGIAVCIMPNVMNAVGLGKIWGSGMYYVLTTAVGAAAVGLVVLFYKKLYPVMTMKRLLLVVGGMGGVLAAGLFVVWRFTDYMGRYGGRTLLAVELGALNVVNLFMPSPNNVIPSLDRMAAVLTEIDNTHACDSTEMGIFTGVGLVYSLLGIFRFRESDDFKDRVVGICGKCNFFMILLAVKGGLASVIASYVTTGIRNYNRIVILITIFSLIPCGILVERVAAKIAADSMSWRRGALSSLLYVGLLAGVAISIPTDYIYNRNFGIDHYDVRKAEYDEWHALVADIEGMSEEGMQILELPVSIDGVYSGILMTDGRAYELSIPACIAKSTIWSFGGGLRSETDALEDTRAYIAEASEKGFGGIYLDTLMYHDGSYAEYIGALKKCLGEPDAGDGRRRYFWKI